VRVYRLIAALGAAGVGVSFAAGLAGAWRWEGQLPGLDQSPGLLGQRAELRGDRATAIRERRAEAVLNAANLTANLANAEKLASLGDFEGASQLLLDVQRRTPGSGPLHASMGWALFFQGQLPQAEHNLRKALDRDPGDAHALAGLGEVLLDQQRYAESIAAFLDSLEREPDHAAVHNSLGVAYATEGRPDLAIPEFEMAVRLAPGSFEANLAKARREAAATAAAPPD